MNNGPLWSQDPYGNYWLVFPNKCALAKTEIKEIFSRFGKVTMVTESGDERGLRFVQYSCLDDTKNAVEHLNDHPLIKLVPYRPKNKNNQNSNKTKEENTDVDPEKRNFFQRKTTNHYNSRNSNERGSSSDTNTTDFQNVEYESNYDRASTCSSGTSNRQINHDDFSSSNSNYYDKSQIRHVSEPIQSLMPAVNPEHKVKMLMQTRGMTSNTFQTDATTSIRNVECDYEDELPDLVVASNKFKSQAKKVIYNADEVIVANIPDNYGSAYILHLLEKFEPLAVSYVKTAPKNETRYCHVYFKSVEDSMGVETMFDKYDLCGKRLVVLRPCNL